jgi:hypothetical protein
VDGLTERVNGLTEQVDGLTGQMVDLSEKVLAAEKSREEGRSMQLKLVITNPELPAYLRSEAYEEYSTVLKKNGWVKAYFEENIRPLLRRQVKGDGR